MKDIKSYEFYGDNPEIFHSLVGFEIADILFTHTKEENENVVVVKCANKQHVEIDLLFKEDGIFVTEPFAVNEDLTIIEQVVNKECWQMITLLKGYPIMILKCISYIVTKTDRRQATLQRK